MQSSSEIAPQPEIPPEIAPFERRTRLWAPGMFGLTCVYLFLLGIFLPHGSTSDEFVIALLGSPTFLTLFFSLWIAILAEGLLGVFQARDGTGKAIRRFLLIAFIPPMRLAFSAARPNREVWFPKSGWIPVNEQSSRVVEVALALPMLFITLAIIPVVALELFFGQLLETNITLGIVVHLATALIWMAFVIEFIMLVGVSKHKLAFCKQHWINIAIIVLPLIAFLRILRLTRLVKVVKAGKMLRIYRLRGVLVRAMRVAMLFNIVERIMRRNPDRFLLGLEKKIAEKKEELAELEEKAAEIRAEIARCCETEGSPDSAEENRPDQPATGT